MLLRSALRSSLPDSGTGSPRADFVITYSAGSEGPVPTRHCPATPRRGRGRPPGGESWNPGILEILECGSSPEEEGESSPGCFCSRSVSWGFVMGHWVTTWVPYSPLWARMFHHFQLTAYCAPAWSAWLWKPQRDSFHCKSDSAALCSSGRPVKWGDSGTQCLQSDDAIMGLYISALQFTMTSVISAQKTQSWMDVALWCYTRMDWVWTVSKQGYARSTLVPITASKHWCIQWGWKIDLTAVHCIEIQYT